MVRFFAQEGMLMGMSIEMEGNPPPTDHEGWVLDSDENLCFKTDGGHLFYPDYYGDGQPRWYGDSEGFGPFTPAPAFTLRYTP